MLTGCFYRFSGATFLAQTLWEVKLVVGTVITKHQHFVQINNETVSFGYAAISLHTLQLQFPGVVFLGRQKSKSPVLANFSFSEEAGGILDYSKLKVPSSSQIFIYAGGEVFLINQKWGIFKKMSKKFAMPNSGGS